MTTYFQPDPNLRAAYGGGAIVLDGSSQEITPATLTLREVAKLANVSRNGAECNLRRATATVPAAGTEYLYVPDDAYYAAAVAPHLTAAELATVVTTAPTGFAANGNRGKFAPATHKTNIIDIGDSITAGVGYGSADDTETLTWLTLPLLTGYTGVTVTGDNTKTYDSPRFRGFNNGIGSSSFDNTVAPDNDFLRRWSLRRAQHIDTLPLPTQTSSIKNIVNVWLGTNDLDRDATLTAAQCWTRAQAFLTALRAAHGSNIKVTIGTALKRSDASGFNTILDTYNNLIRAGWAGAGFDGLCDFERLTVDTGGVQIYKCITDGFGPQGVAAANTTWYNGGDGVHPTKAGYDRLKLVRAAAINSLL